MTVRVKSLDWLRGLMALSIMFYHLLGGSDSDTILDKLGIYGVSIFFIISGLSMALAYDHYFTNLLSIKNFIVKRVFRIWPLFWICVALVTLPNFPIYFNTFESFKLLALNLTTSFGFFAPTQYIPTGGWSIGSEMVYYALTPILINTYRWHKWLGNSITLLSIFIGLIFAFYFLNSSSKLASQWAVYINPFNNLFLYCSGLALYFNFKNIEISCKWGVLLLLISVYLFWIYPSFGDQINIVTGFNRLFMSLISWSIVFCFYKSTFSLPKLADISLGNLGIISYGIYLFHPIIIKWTKNILHIEINQNFYLFLFLVTIQTIIISLISFRYVERPFMILPKTINKLRSRRIRY